MRKRLLLATLLLLAAISRSANAQKLENAPIGATAAENPSEQMLRIGIVVAGGISLGSYQGGMTWALTSMLRALRDSSELRAAYGMNVRPNVVALGGASAGNINSLLSLNTWCRSKPHVNWRQSLHWTVWSQVGVDELLPERRNAYMPNDGLFSRVFMNQSLKPLIDSALAETVVESCDVHIATTMTALNRRLLSLGNLTVQSQRVVSIVRAFHGDSNQLRLSYPDNDIRSSPKFVSQVYLTERRRRPRFDLSGRFDVPRDVMFRQSLASSAIPAVFGPLTMHYFASLTEEGGVRATCPPDPQATGFCAQELNDVFVDGGVFDNTPIELTRHLLERRMAPDTADQQKRLLLFVATDRERGPASTTRGAISAGREMGFGGVSALLGSAIPTARQYELQGAIRREAEQLRDTVVALADGHHIRLGGVSRNSETSAQLAVTSRRYPVYGNEVGAFGAFIDRRLREYDFLQGIYDGAYVLSREVLCRDSTSMRDSCTTVVHRRLLREKALGLTTADAAFLYCLLEYDYSPTRPDSLCSKANKTDSLSDRSVRLLRIQFRALEQVQGNEYYCRKASFIASAICASRLYAALSTLGTDPEYRRELGRTFGKGGSDWDIIDSSQTAGVTAPRAYLQQDQYWEELLYRVANRAFIVEKAKGRSNGGQTLATRFAGYAVHALSIPYDRDAHRWFRVRGQSAWSLFAPDYVSATQGGGLGIGYRVLSDRKPGHSVAFSDARLLRMRIPNGRAELFGSEHVGYSYQRVSFLYSGMFLGIGGSGCFCSSEEYRSIAPTLRLSVNTLFQRATIGVEQQLGRYADRFIGFKGARTALEIHVNDIRGFTFWGLRR